MTVISLADARKEREPHWEGSCKCIECQHEWVGVGPIGEMWVECPSCHLPKGHPKYPFCGDDGDFAFTCDCGSDAMTAYKRKGHFYLRCMACGLDQTEAIYG